MKKKQPNEQRITALYARLSRDDEKDGVSGSIENQRAILEAYAKDNHQTEKAAVQAAAPRIFIRECVVGQLVLEGLQRLMWYVQVYEDKFAHEQMERFGLQEKKELAARRRELDKAKQRVAEIDRIIQKSYEDMVKGLLSEERFATLTVSLESEQKQLKVSIPEMEAGLQATTDKAADLQRFIERIRQVTRLTELTPEIVHEFIEKIVVSKPDTVDGKRHQTVDIYYNTIGLWVAPEPEVLEREYMVYYQNLRKHKKKRRNRGHAAYTRKPIIYNTPPGQLPYGSCPGGQYFRRWLEEQPDYACFTRYPQ